MQKLQLSLIISLLSIQCLTSYLLWKKDDLAASQPATFVIPGTINEGNDGETKTPDATVESTLQLEKSLALFTEEQRNINRLILETLAQISVKTQNLSEPAVSNASFAKQEYQATEYYDAALVENAGFDSQILVDDIIASQNWTPEDHTALLDLAPYLDQKQRDAIREQLITAVNEQRLALHTPLILPF